MRIAQECRRPWSPGEKRDAKEAEIRAEVEMPSSSRPSQAGGLYIVGTERHESRRIDNQLRGRDPAARATPGRSKFFLSLQDDLMRIFRVRTDGHGSEAARPAGGRGDRPSMDQ